VAHGIPFLHHQVEALEHSLAGVPIVAWLAKVVVCALGGLVLGGIIDKIVGLFRKRK
jgi:predicted DNA repair protein MutK